MTTVMGARKMETIEIEGQTIRVLRPHGSWESDLGSGDGFCIAVIPGSGETYRSEEMVQHDYRDEPSIIGELRTTTALATMLPRSITLSIVPVVPLLPLPVLSLFGII